MNYSIVNKDDTSSNISKPSPFENENDRSEDVAETIREQDNTQQMNNSIVKQK